MNLKALAFLLTLITAGPLFAQEDQPAPPAPKEPFIGWRSQTHRTVLNDIDTIVATVQYRFDDHWMRPNPFTGSIHIEVQKAMIVNGQPVLGDWESLPDFWFAGDEDLDSDITFLLPLGPVGVYSYYRCRTRCQIADWDFNLFTAAEDVVLTGAAYPDMEQDDDFE